MQDQSLSGFDAIPFLKWGSHLGQFYESADDLRDVLVPYFQAGLQNNESCLWVTSAPFDASQARAALRVAIPDFDAREARKQIEIRDANEWYGADDKVEPDDLIADLLRREQNALDQGYEGLRTNGNCAWLHEGQWVDFQAYEARVHATIRGRRMICMCSYCPDAIEARDALEVMERHDFILPRPARGEVSRTLAPGRRSTAPNEELSVLLEALPAAIYTTDADGFLTYYNEAAARLWGYQPKLGEQRWCGTWKIFLFDGTEVPHDQCPMALAVKTGQPVHGIEAMAERPDGVRVPCAVYPTPLFDERGDVVGGVNLLVDITDRKAAEDRNLILAREMHHRVNNTLGTVQAIMGSTMRHTANMDEFQASFTARIRALSKTHALLTRRSEATVSLRELFDSELDMFADGNDGRVTLVGPDLILPERLALPIGMAIHELATNAAKYGALSVLGGALSVQWRHAQAELEIRWSERNVPMGSKSERVGFGTRLLEEILPRQIGAAIAIQHELDGLDATLVIPI